MANMRKQFTALVATLALSSSLTAAAIAKHNFVWASEVESNELEELSENSQSSVKEANSPISEHTESSISESSKIEDSETVEEPSESHRQALYSRMVSIAITTKTELTTRVARAWQRLALDGQVNW